MTRMTTYEVEKGIIETIDENSTLSAISISVKLFELEHKHSPTLVGIRGSLVASVAVELIRAGMPADLAVNPPWLMDGIMICTSDDIPPGNFVRLIHFPSKTITYV